jgi:hypothetical protein
VTATNQFFSVLVLEWPSSLVANGNVPRSGVALHFLSVDDDDMRITRSFGPESLPPRRYDFPRLWQVLTPSAGGFWAASVSRYHLTRWTSDGRLLASLTRDPAWFENTGATGIGTPTQPPPPAITAVHEDDEGLLWVFVRVPGRTWREGWPHAS